MHPSRALVPGTAANVAVTLATLSQVRPRTLALAHCQGRQSVAGHRREHDPDTPRFHIGRTRRRRYRHRQGSDRDRSPAASRQCDVPGQAHSQRRRLERPGGAASPDPGAGICQGTVQAIVRDYSPTGGMTQAGATPATSSSRTPLPPAAPTTAPSGSRLPPRSPRAVPVWGTGMDARWVRLCIRALPLTNLGIL